MISYIRPDGEQRLASEVSTPIPFSNSVMVSMFDSQTNEHVASLEIIVPRNDDD